MKFLSAITLLSFLLLMQLTGNAQLLTLSGANNALFDGDYQQNPCFEGYEGYVAYGKSIGNGGGVTIQISGEDYHLISANITRTGDIWELWSNCTHVNTGNIIRTVWGSIASDTPSPPCGVTIFGATISGSACATPNCVINPTINSPVYVCSGTEAIIQASTSVYWYDLTTSNSCSPFAAGQQINLPNVTASKTFHIRTKAACGYSDFIPVEMIVSEQPTLPTASAYTICSGTSVTLSSTCQNGILQWFEQPNGGTMLGTGSYATPILTTNKTYYVECWSTCGTTNRVQIHVSIGLSTISLTGIGITGLIQASISIASTQVITSDNKVFYKAGNAIQLNPGFVSDNGTVFKAVIEDCQ